MTRKLPNNFELDRYGLHCRLVKEEDAAFIVSLRTRDDLTKYFPKIDNDVKKQIEWIKQYKEREQNGMDYYFVFFYKGEKIGLNRIYEIKDDGTFICGSLIFDRTSYKMASLASLLIVREIAFENLDLKEEIDHIGTHIENSSLVLCKEKIGFKNTGYREDALGLFVTANLTKEDFYKNKVNIEHFLLK